MSKAGESTKEFQKRVLEHKNECGGNIQPLNTTHTIYQCTKCNIVMECGWDEINNGESNAEFNTRIMGHVKKCGSKGMIPSNNRGTMFSCIRCGISMRRGYK